MRTLPNGNSEKNRLTSPGRFAILRLAFPRQQVGSAHKSCRGRQIFAFAIRPSAFADRGAVPFFERSVYALFLAGLRAFDSRSISWR